MRTVSANHELAQLFNGEEFSEVFKGRIRNNYAGSLPDYGKTMLAFESFESPLGYVEDLNDARTKLADCFSTLLEEFADQLDCLFRRSSGMDEIGRETREQAHASLIRT